MKTLCQKLNYYFRDAALLKRALTHRSANEEHNERLEFLGDSVVNFITADALYQRFQEAPEGDLSRWRATLINRETLAQMAQGFELGNYLILGDGELKSGGSRRSSILSCAMEAVIGAIYLDGGFDAVKQCILEWYKPYLATLGKASSLKDPKTRLQEYMQALHKPLPEYRVERVEGKMHEQIFIVHCTVPGTTKMTQGQGTARRRAEQAAAEAMLRFLKNE